MKPTNLLGIILFVLLFSLVSCNPNGTILPEPDPKPKPTAVDTVIIEVTVSIPDCASISSSEVKFWDTALPNGIGIDEYYGNAEKVHAYTFTGDAAKKLIGTQCLFSAVLEGRNCIGSPASFHQMNGPGGSGGQLTMTLTKGLNKAVIIYDVK